MESLQASKAWRIDAENSAVNLKPKEREPVLETIERYRHKLRRKVGPAAELHGLLPQPPEAERIEGRQYEPSFRLKDPYRLAKNLLRIFGEIERMGKRHQIHGFALNRQLRRIRNDPVEREFRVAEISPGVNQPVRLHAVGGERIELRHADLKRAGAEDICRCRRFSPIQGEACRGRKAENPEK